MDPVAISWPLELFDPETGQLKPRFPDDQLCYDNKVDIAKHLARACDIRAFFRLNSSLANAKEFKRLFSNPHAKNDFIKWCEALLPELQKQPLIFFHIRIFYHEKPPINGG